MNHNLAPFSRLFGFERHPGNEETAQEFCSRDVFKGRSPLSEKPLARMRPVSVSAETWR